MLSQPLPPALSAIIADALTKRQVVDLGALKLVLDQDPASLRGLAYQDLPTLTAALAEFDALPADTPHRTKIAAVLVYVCVGSTVGSFEHENFDRAAALARIAVTDPDVPAEWRGFFIMIRSRALTAEVQRGTAFPRPRAIVAEFEGYRGLTEALPPWLRSCIGAHDQIPQWAARRVIRVIADQRTMASECSGRRS